MKQDLKRTMDNTPNSKYKVVEVTKDYYKLYNAKRIMENIICDD